MKSNQVHIDHILDLRLFAIQKSDWASYCGNKYLLANGRIFLPLSYKTSQKITFYDKT
jgi:hypothetical protein|tara:strand:- start:372 stop:545 length:174 start_codon:yes stop_codon:yes gene_type:complete